MYKITEREVEVNIDRQLKNLKWINDTSNPKRNVYYQNVKTEEQRRALNNKRPDYILYKDNS